MKTESAMKKPRMNKQGTLSAAEETYCRMKDATGDDRRSYFTAFPGTINLREKTIEKRITRLNSSPKVQKRIIELRNSFIKASDGKYDGLKDEVIKKIVDGIRQATDANPTAIEDFVPSIRILSDILGWNAPKNYLLYSSAQPPRYNPIAELTDEELTERLNALRGR